jgi:excisionase family DNA binding protein
MEDIDQPWPPHQLLRPEQVAEYLGVSKAWVKRARLDGIIEFVKVRGGLRIKARTLYAYVEDNTEPAKPKPITRYRSAEHNRKIGESVRRARAQRAQQARKGA